MVVWLRARAGIGSRTGGAHRPPHGRRRRRSRLAALIATATAAFGLASVAPLPAPDVASADPPYLDGVASGCANFELYLGLFSVDIPDPGWTWVDPNDIFQDASGVALKSEVTHTDFPVVHDSHDINVDVLLDPGQEGLLSIVNPDKAEPSGPDTIEVEWEIGTFPTEHGPNSPERYLPKWAWPNQGDRVWVNGHHIYDCGHTTPLDGIERARSEIHPPRAMAAIRDQVGTLPGTGTTPVPLTAVDLYIHGNAGFVTEILYCGQELIIGDASTQDTSGEFDCATDTTPIDDDFQFDVPLPPRPTPSAVLATSIEDGPGNTIDVAPVLTPNDVNNPTSVQVTVPLEGTGVADLDTYARQMKVGWVYPPDELRHFNLTLDKMDLHDDMDVDPGDCECSFFWLNVDKAPSEWIRLADFATGNMNDYDDDGGLGDGEIGFSGAVFDYYMAGGAPVSVRAHGYDQDCLDDYFGDHRFRVTIFLDCYLLAAFELEAGDNDDFAVLSATHGAPDYGVGKQDVTADGQYELEYTITELAVEEEDSADLALRKICKPDDLGLAGETVRCTILVDNPGPGLPRDVVVTDTLLTNADPGDYDMVPASVAFEFEGVTSSSSACTMLPPNQFTCALGTVPVGGRAVISSSFTSDEAGDFNNEAIVRSSSNDPDLGNNADVDGLTIQPVSDLEVDTQDSIDPVIAGTSFTYTVDVTNRGPSTARNTLVSDVLPAGVTILGVDGGPGSSCNAGVPGTASLPTTCGFDSIAPGATRTMTVEVRADPATAGTISNDARASSDSIDPNNGNSFDVETTLVEAHADLVVTKSGSPTSVVAGEDLTYRIDVRNEGPSLARDVRIVDSLPSGTSPLGATITRGAGACASSIAAPHSVSCTVGDLAPGASAQVFVDVHVDSAQPAGTIENTVTATSDAIEDDVSTNTGTEVTSVTVDADLGIVKTSDADLYKSSSTIDYELTVTNHGSSDAADVVVIDHLPNPRIAYYVFDDSGCALSGDVLTCVVGDLAAGEVWTAHVFVRVKGSKGQITNVAAVSSPTPDSVSWNDDSTRIVLVQGKSTPRK